VGAATGIAGPASRADPGGCAYTQSMDVPEETRELDDVTIRACETRPGFFEVSFRPLSPESHLARGGYTLDTARGLRGRTLKAVLDRAEANWRLNYPRG
jgi:hypothetical protein